MVNSLLPEEILISITFITNAYLNISSHSLIGIGNLVLDLKYLLKTPTLLSTGMQIVSTFHASSILDIV